MFQGKKELALSGSEDNLYVHNMKIYNLKSHCKAMAMFLTGKDL